MHSNIWRIVAKVIRKHKFKSILMVFAVVGSIISALIPPLVLGKMIDNLSDKSQIVIWTAFLYLATFIVSSILESVQNIMITVVGQSITHEIRYAMSSKLHNLPASYYTEHETGMIASRFVNDVDAVDSLFTNGIIGMIADGFKVISIMFVIMIKSRGLGILMCIVTPILFVMTIVFQHKMRSAQLKNRVAVAKVNHHVPETIQNIRMIHNFKCESYMERKYSSYIEDGYKAMDQSNFYDSIYSPIVIFTSSMIIAIMMVCSSYGSSLQYLFGISVGNAVAIIAYVGKVFDPLESLGMEIHNIQSALAGVERIDEFLNEEEMFRNKNVKHNQEVQLSGPADIHFEHVSFDYGDGKTILSDINLDIKQGEHVIFTGRTGAGKSTLFKLILGLYRPSAGKVYIGNIDASDIADQDRRKVFGYVEQQFSIVEGTLRDQINLFDKSIGDDIVWNVLELCNLKEKIESMSAGLDTQMSAADFSQGQLQLMSIARALALEPKVMLLDEITANLDSMTEQRILEIINTASKGRTVISISHRLAEQLQDTRIIEM